ncbi:MAG: hypothetical protein DRI75_12075 [Bacteroidetes bacterium]|nr:MAG: hypothetical protein DRI75_12075 [Bacteroidota bacterium]
MNRICFFIVITILLVSCKNEKAKNELQHKNYLQIAKNRMAAEWEPANGVFFVWPPYIPKELIIEFAKDTHIYPFVAGEEGKKEAEKWFEKWGIDLANVTFINLKTGGENTPRDWGPSAVFMKNGDFKITDGQYKYASTFTDLACNDSIDFIKTKSGEIYHSPMDTVIVPIANQLGFEVLKLPFTNTGGNVLTDGIGTAFSTCALLTENRFNGVSDQEFFNLNDSLLGFTKYNIISNFDMMGIQHVDCLLKLVDEETILVAQPPEDHELFSIYDDIVNNELSKLKTAYGRPYTIKRIKIAQYYEEDQIEYLTAYTNSIILNKNVYVPLFGVKEDSLALKTWESVMPGYTVKGFSYNLDELAIEFKSFFEGFDELGVKTGWLYEDAVHCRTKAIWDEDMIFISVKKVLPEILIDQEAILYSTIIDYSGESLSTDDIVVNWKIKGETKWNEIKMSMDNHPNHWTASFPIQEKNMIIEYYIEVKSNTGKTQRRPISAPEGYYEFKYVAQQGI